MAHEIVISSDEEVAHEARTITLSDSSDEESIVPSSTAAAPRPFARPTWSTKLPPLHGKAARKSAPGSSLNVRPRPTAPKHRTSQPSQRTPTTRTIVKTEQDDLSPFAASRLSQVSILDDERDPPLTEIPYPFDVAIRLEEIRLALKAIPALPVVKLEIAFRHVDQKADDAPPAASASFPLVLPANFSPGTLVDLPSSSTPRPTLLRISRDPAIPLKVPNPFAVPRPPQPLAEILIRTTILDAGAPGTPVIYRRGNAVSDGVRLCLRGECRQRPTPEGSQVTVGWGVALPEDAVKRVPPSEAELEEWIEREMKRCEGEWRREAAERAMAAAEIEAQPPPLYGPPPNLTLDPTAPSPASLIPGLDPSSPPPQPPLRFAPVPPYFHTGYASRGVPLFGTLLETFPQTKDWEDPRDVHQVEAQILDALDPGLATDEEEGEALEAAEAERRAEIELRKRTFVDHGSFDAPDVGRTIRDFTVLKRLFAHLQVDFGELAKLENEANAQDDAENQHDFDHFAFERSLAEDHVVRRALGVFEERTGRTAYRVQQDHRLIDDEELIAKRVDGEFCWMCGAFSCTVHAGTLAAYNVPTKAPFDPSSKAPKGCTACGSTDCLVHAQQEGAIVNDALEQALRAEGMPSLDPCTASLLLQRPVNEASFTPNPPAHQPGRPDKSTLKKWHSVILRPMDSSGYVPCDCAGLCTGNCMCASNDTYCDRWCACPANCSRRFRGCDDHNCAEEKSCWCRDRSRECDPQICGCSAATCKNSAARLGRQKAITVVRSQIPGGGYGAVLLEPAQKDDLIGLYAGEQFPQELEDVPTMESRWGYWKKALSEFVAQSYWFNIDRSDAMDSMLLGNVVRFINHSAKANVRSNIFNIAGTHQIAIYALKVLKAGDELFLDYGPEYVEAWREGSRP